LEGLATLVVLSQYQPFSIMFNVQFYTWSKLYSCTSRTRKYVNSSNYLGQLISKFNFTNEIAFNWSPFKYKQLPRLYKVFYKKAHILMEIQYSVVSLYFHLFPKEIGLEIKYSNQAIFVLEMILVWYWNDMVLPHCICKGLVLKNVLS
jgi:hypothetical protein